MKASVALFIIMLTVIFSCQKSISDKQTNQSVSTNADEVSSGSIAPYNLDVALSGDGKGVGLLRFRQKKILQELSILTHGYGTLNRITLTCYSALLTLSNSEIASAQRG